MNALAGRKLTSIRGAVVCLACVVVSGCELARPNFQMNSNSPTPFFGIDLIPRRSTTSIAKPRPNEQLTTTEAGSGDVHQVENSSSLGRFLNKKTKWNDQSERTVVLPLTRVDPDHPIDRGPVELLP